MSDTQRSRNAIALANHEQDVDQLSFKQRFDYLFATSATLAGVVLLVFVWLTINWIRGNGWLEPDLIEQLEDPRLLTNIRSAQNEVTPKLLDATFHLPDDKIYISQKGGKIHKYSPDTRLWSQSTPFNNKQLGSYDFTLLQSGCGTLAQSNKVNECPDPDTLWALTDSGALVRRDDGEWKIVVADTQFTGTDGKPVEHDALTQAAISDDENWLALGTRNQGIGFYHQNTRRWFDTSQDESQKPSQVTHLKWWKGYFWRGGVDGLYKVSPPPKAKTEGKAVISNNILDMDISSEDELWILASIPCGNLPCLTLSMIKDPNSIPAVVMNSGQRHDSLNLSKLHYTLYSAPYLYLAGENGIFSYDVRTRTWQQLNNQPLKVSATHTFSTKDGFYFSATNVVGHVVNNKAVTHILNRDHIHQFAQANDKTVGLAKSGDLYHISQAPPKKIFNPKGTAHNPASFTDAVGNNDTVILDGPKGMLLHYTKTRSYKDYGASWLPHCDLSATDKNLYLSSNQIYRLCKLNNQVQVLTVPFHDYINGWSNQNRYNSAINGKPRSVELWPKSTLAIVDGNNRPHVATRTNDFPLVGAPSPIQSTQQIIELDKVAHGIRLVDQRHGIYDYYYQDRKWQPVQNHLVDQKIVQVATPNTNSTNFAFITDQQRLWQFNNNKASELHAGKSRLTFNNQNLSDALQVNNLIYLAGNGDIQAYDMNSRNVSYQRKLYTNKAVDLIGVRNENTISISNNSVFYGRQVVSHKSQGASLAGNTMAVVKNDKKHKYIEVHQLKGSNYQIDRCFFANAQPLSPIESVDDAISFGDNSVAVLSHQLLNFYSPKSRSWFSTNDTGFSKGERIYDFNGQFLIAPAHNGEDATIAFVDKRFTQPHDCSINPVQFKTNKKLNIKALAIDINTTQPDQQIAWQDDSNQVLVSNDKVALAANQTALPLTKNLTRFYQQSGSDWIDFPVGNTVWSYDLKLRQWFTARPNNFRPSEFNFEWSGNNSAWFTAKNANHIISGKFNHNTNAAPSFSSELTSYTPPRGQIAQSHNELRQVYSTTNDQYWTLVFQQGVDFYDHANKRWVGSESFSLNSNVTLQTMSGHEVLVDKNNNTTTWRKLSKEKPEAHKQFTFDDKHPAILASEGNIWQANLNNGTVANKLWALNAINDNASTHPFTITPQNIEYALTHNQTDIIADNNNVRFHHNFLSANQPVIDLPNMSYARKTGRDYYWLGNGSQAAQVYMHDSGVAQEDYCRGVSTIVQTKGDTYWALGKGGLWYQKTNQPKGSRNRLDCNNSNWLTPRTRTHKVWVYEDATPSAIDGDKLLQWKGELFDTFRTLPTSINASDIHTLTEGYSDSWWIVESQQLKYVSNEVCERSVPIKQNTALSQAYPYMVPPYKDEVEKFYCILVLAKGSLPPSIDPRNIDLMRIMNLSNDLLITTNQGIKREFQYAKGQITSIPSNANTTNDDFIGNQWQTLRQNVGQIGGVDYYKPVVGIRIDNGEIIAERPNDTLKLASSGTTPAAPVQPLDIDWLRYEPTPTQQGQFVVKQLAQSANEIPIPAQSFLPNGRFLFETVDTLLAKNDDEFYAANQFGIWRYNNQSLSLDDKAIQYLPLDWQSNQLNSSHGHIFSQSEKWKVGDTQLSNNPNNAIIINGGKLGLTLTQQGFNNPSITATVTREGSNIDAFATTNPRGFFWDHNKLGLGWLNDNLYIQFAEGFVTKDDYQDILAGPSNVNLTRSQLHTQSGKQLHLKERSGQWWQRAANGNWTKKSTSPDFSRTLLSNNIWHWSKNNKGQLNIALKNQQQQSGFTFFKQGKLQFSNDRLQSASFNNNTLHVMTDAFHETVNDLNALSNLSAKRYKPTATDKLESFSYVRGNQKLFSTKNSRVTEWDGNSFIAPNKNPYIEHLLVENARLKFTLKRNTIEKKLKVDLPGNQQQWVDFDIDPSGKFEFDQFSAIEYKNGQYLLGTHLGLQTARSLRQTGLLKLDKIYDLRPNANSNQQRVIRIGHPASNPQKLAACSKDYCVTNNTSGDWVKDQDKSLLVAQSLAGDFFWHWQKTGSNNKIAGQYKLAQGQSKTAPVKIRNGLFEHDSMTQLLSHQDITKQNTPVQKWTNGWITHYPNTTDFTKLPVQRGMQTFALPSNNLKLLSRSTPYTGIKGSVPTGLFAIAPNGSTLYEFNNTKWQQVTNNDDLLELTSFLTQPIIMQEGKLQLRQPTNNHSFKFEWLNSNNQWQTIPWHKRPIPGEPWAIAIDNWRFVHPQNNKLTAASDFGFAHFDFGATGVSLNPKQLTIIRAPMVAGNQDKIETEIDVGIFDNKTIMRFGYNSKKLYSVDFASGQKDTNVFTKFAGKDPFVVQERVNQPFWQWQTQDRVNGSQGRLTGLFREQQIYIDAGQFRFDAINSLANFDLDRWELGTDLAGWYQVNKNADDAYPFSLDKQTRPTTTLSTTQVDAINHVTIMRKAANEGLLLQSDKGHHFVHKSNEKKIESIKIPLTFENQDSLWRFDTQTTDKQQLRISAIRSEGGIALRKLEQGRFTDDIVIGPPATGSDEQGMYYLLPTKAGIFRLSGVQLKPIIAYAPPYLENSKEMPTAVWFDTPTTPVFAVKGQAVELYGNRKPMSKYDINLPPNAKLTSTVWGPDDLLRYNWKAGDSGNRYLGWTLSPLSFDAHNYGYKLMSDSQIVRANSSDWQNPNELLHYSIYRKAENNYWIGFANENQDSFEAPLNKECKKKNSDEKCIIDELIKVIPYQQRLIIVGNEELLDVSLEKGIMGLMED